LLGIIMVLIHVVGTEQASSIYAHFTSFITIILFTISIVNI
jgi:hypothetical protein